MIVVHDIFICKPGNASTIAKLFKEWTEVTTEKNTTAAKTIEGLHTLPLTKFCMKTLSDYND